MATTTAQHTVAWGRRHVAAQEGRIARQSMLIAQLESGGRAVEAQQARDELATMTAALQRMRDDLARAGAGARAGRKADDVEPLDEDSLDAVMRDCPL